MSYIASLIPCSYIPANFAVSSVVAEMNAQFASAAASQAATSATAAVSTSTSAAAGTAVSSATASSSVASAGTTAAASSAAAALSTVALPIAVSLVAMLAAGLIIDIAKAQKELRRCQKLSIETVFTSRDALVEALFSHGGEDSCQIYEEQDGSLIVRYQLQDYFFHMNPERGCFDLEIINAQHPVDELEKINQIQLHYIEAVRQHTYRSLMETVAQQGWTVERNEAGEDGSIYVSILV